MSAGIASCINQGWHGRRESVARADAVESDLPRTPVTGDRSGHPCHPGTRVIRVVLLGCGTVGSRVARALVDERARLASRTGFDLRLERILVRSAASRRSIAGGARDGETTSQIEFTDRFDDVLASRPDVVIELLGGVEPAGTWIAQLLRAGIHVVTANKTVLAHRGRELRAAAASGGAILAHEGAVASAVPILSALRQLEGDVVQSIRGIVNGSTNFILDRMTEAGLSAQDALKEATSRGLVEPDPSADISGRDAAEKLCILAAAAGASGVTVDDIDRQGIENVSAADILAARRLGYAIKLVAELTLENGRTHARVGPTLVPRDHRLARVRLAENGIEIGTQFGGDLFLQGPGAGPEPTTSAILGDLLRVLKGDGALHLAGREAPRCDATDSAAASAGESGFARANEEARVHYVRLRYDRSALSPARLFECFRAACVPCREVDVSGGQTVLVTHAVRTSAIRAALEAASNLTSLDSLVVPELGGSRRTRRSSGSAEIVSTGIEPVRRSA